MSKTPLSFNIDAEAFGAQFKELAMEIEQDLNKAVEQLASMAHGFVVEKVSEELSSATAMKYLEHLNAPDKVETGIWVVTLNPEAFWIEEGIPAGFDMKPGLLKNGEQGKNGKYKVVPFDHGQPPSRMSEAHKAIAQQIKNEVQKKFAEMNKDIRKAAKENREKPNTLSWKKIELDDNGSPRTGRLHTFNFGGDIPGKGNTPAMDRVNIYQSTSEKGVTRRDIMTFRTVTQNQQGKWIHPGYNKKEFFDKAFEHAMQMWEQEILPAILKKYE